MIKGFVSLDLIYTCTETRALFRRAELLSNISHTSTPQQQTLRVCSSRSILLRGADKLSERLPHFISALAAPGGTSAQTAAPAWHGGEITEASEGAESRGRGRYVE